MLQYYSYSLPSTLAGVPCTRGVKRKFESLRCGYTSSDSPNVSQSLLSPISGQYGDRKRQQAPQQHKERHFSTPVNEFGGQNSNSERERVQSMDLDLSVACKSSSSLSATPTSSSASFASSISSSYGLDSQTSKGRKQQLGIRMFFNTTAPVNNTEGRRGREIQTAVCGRKENHIETCIFCIRPPEYVQEAQQVFYRMTSTSCAFCNRSSCSDCITDCVICHHEFCKFCITTNYNESFDRTVCLDCDKSENDGVSKMEYSF